MTGYVAFFLMLAGFFMPAQVFAAPKWRVLAAAVLFGASAGFAYGIWAAFFTVAVTAWGALEMTSRSSLPGTKGATP